MFFQPQFGQSIGQGLVEPPPVQAQLTFSEQRGRVPPSISSAATSRYNVIAPPTNIDIDEPPEREDSGAGSDSEDEDEARDRFDWEDLDLSDYSSDDSEPSQKSQKSGRPSVQGSRRTSHKTTKSYASFAPPMAMGQDRLQVPPEWTKIRQHGQMHKKNRPAMDSIAAIEEGNEAWGYRRFSNALTLSESTGWSKLCQAYSLDGVLGKDMRKRITDFGKKFARPSNSMLIHANKMRFKIPWSKLYIFRDFLQALSVVFAAFFPSATLVNVEAFGEISGFVGLNWNWFISDDVIVTLFWVTVALTGFCIVVYLGLYSFVTFPDEEKFGEDIQRWEEKQFEKNLIWITANVIITMYVPMCKRAFDVLLCTPPSQPERNCADGDDGDCTYSVESTISDQFDGLCSGWAFYISGFMIFLLFVFFPGHFINVINKDKPDSLGDNKTHNERGEVVEFTDERYQKEIQSEAFEARPYTFLMTEYKRKYAFYKVIQLVEKVLIVAASVWAASGAFGDEDVVEDPKEENLTTLGGVIAVFGLQVVGVLFVYFAQPYIDRSNNFMELFGRVANLFTTCLAWIGMGELSRNAATALGIFIEVMLAIFIAIMLWFIIQSLPWVKAKKKELLSTLEFNDSNTAVVSSDPSTIMTWSISDEIVNRIWMPVWDYLIKTETDGDATAQKTKKQTQLATRFSRIKEAVKKFGIQRVKTHHAEELVPAVRWLRSVLVNHLEGMDVCWFDSGHGYSSGGSPFGRLYIRMFPFTVSWCSEVTRKPEPGDPGHDIRNQWEFEDLLNLVEYNFSNEIVEIRWNRTKVRALRGQMCAFAHQANILFEKVPDGIEERWVTNSKGEKEMTIVQLYSDIPVLVSFERGVFTCTGVGERMDPKGDTFTAAINYKDGRGQATKPRTGELFVVSNHPYTLEDSEIGVYQDMRSNTNLTKLFSNNPTQLRRGVPEVLGKFELYRNRMREKREKEKSIMTPEFWFLVYANDGINQDQLKANLQRQPNPILRNLADTHKEEIDMLFARMDYVRQGLGLV
mmetsp:Transcript_23033/g.54579  ORF Transcript_23033/g.54579 Transcript_23033/m.54579 type:complete len:1027 (-) Transcript_23033:1158-4238(-)